MTHSGGKPHVNVGDRGQRYEVIGIMHDGTREVVGWTNEANGGSLFKGVTEWPRYKSAEIQDRGVPYTPPYSED